MRSALIAAASALLLAGCGNSAKHVTTTTPLRPLPSFAKARAGVLTTKTARVDQVTTIVLSGTEVKAHDTGRLAFDGSRAHIYKLTPGGQFPGEVIVIGPFTYTNANVQASLQAPEVQPWTKLDTRKLSAKDAANQTDELSHVLAPAYLAFGATHVTLRRRVTDGAVFWARIDPAAVLSSISAARRTKIEKAVRADYPATDFNARFWIDSGNHIRRVIVAWATKSGTPIALDTSYSAFGSPVDTKLPPARSIKDITPKS
ncbi:MAG: hypothetical protein ACTHKS_06425 [Gaiellaceae bacterium]